MVGSSSVSWVGSSACRGCSRGWSWGSFATSWASRSPCRGMLMRGYLQPGVPWLAFVMLLFWCVLEAAVFTYTLEARVATLVRISPERGDSRFTIPVLYLLVLTLIVASFACVQALVDAVPSATASSGADHRDRDLLDVLRVMFLYRGVVEVTMPWIARDNTATLRWPRSAGSASVASTWFSSASMERCRSLADRAAASDGCRLAPISAAFGPSPSGAGRWTTSARPRLAPRQGR